MCDYVFDNDIADVWHKQTPRARKAYICSECRMPILIGTVHQRITAMQDGSWTKFRTHVECAELLEYIAFSVCQQSVVIYESDATLRERVREHLDDDASVLGMWRDVLRLRRAEGSWPRRRVSA